MLIVWAYNELGADLSPADDVVEIKFRRAGGAATPLYFKINDEQMYSTDWGAFTILTNSLVGNTTPVTRGIGGPAKYHKEGDVVWIQEDPNKIQTSTLATSGYTQTANLLNNTHALAIVSDGRGGFYVGGDFDTANATSVTGLVHVNADGELDTTYAPDVSGGTGTVYALWLLDNGNLVVGGDFSDLGGSSCASLGVIDPYGVLVQDMSVPTGPVRCITGNDEYVFVGGVLLNGSDSGLLRFSITDDILVSSGNNFDIVTVGSDIHALLLDGDTLYAGGDVGGVFGSFLPRGNGFALQASANINYGSNQQEALLGVLPWDPDADDIIRTLGIYDGYIYIGGDFANVGAQAQDNLARVDATTGAVDTTWLPASLNGIVYTLAINDKDPIAPQVIAGGAFTTPRTRLAAFAVEDAALNVWNASANAAIRGIHLEKGRVHLVGAFDTVGNSQDKLAILSDQVIASQIGDYKVDYLDESPQVVDPIISVAIKVYNDPSTDFGTYTEQLITSKTSTRDGDLWEGPSFTFSVTNLNHLIEVEILRASGERELEYYVKEPGITDEVVVIPDGVETGDPYTEGDTFAAPGVVKMGNSYTVTPDTETGSPTTTATRAYYRMWFIVDIDDNSMEDYRVTFGGTTDTVAVDPTHYYEVRVLGTTNGNTNLTALARDNVAATLVTTGPHAVTADASTDQVNPDQVQVELEETDGAWGARIISDWQSVPVSGDFVYASIGPAARQFRFRYRYRDFHRDGMVGESTRPTMTSAWSSWSTLA